MKKLTSRRFIAALWSMVMITVIVILNRAEFATLTIFLAGVVGVWIGAETVSKKAFLNAGGSNE
jgi:hypothetical protein